MRFDPLARCVCALGAMVLLASCAETKTTQLENGLQVSVTPLTAERNDLADLLDAKTWRLSVGPVKANQLLTVDLEIREKGKPARRISGIGVSPPERDKALMDVVVGMMPLDNSWEKADKIKLFVRAGGASSAGIKSNPFKDILGSGSGPAELQKDGSFLLMTASKTKDKSASWPDAGDNDLTLALTLNLSDGQGATPTPPGEGDSTTTEATKASPEQ